jgi:uncharacterized protein YuzE
MAIANLRKKDLSKILKAVPGLINMPERSMWIDYDSEADVLYISFERPQSATDSEMSEDGVIVRRRGRKVVGVTILEASQR